MLSLALKSQFIISSAENKFADNKAVGTASVFGQGACKQVGCVWEGLADRAGGVHVDLQSRRLEQRAFQGVFLDPLKETCVHSPKCKKSHQRYVLPCILQQQRVYLCWGIQPVRGWVEQHGVSILLHQKA